MASDAGSMRRVSFGDCGDVSFRSCAYLFQIDNISYVKLMAYPTLDNIDAIFVRRNAFSGRPSGEFDSSFFSEAVGNRPGVGFAYRVGSKKPWPDRTPSSTRTVRGYL